MSPSASQGAPQTSSPPSANSSSADQVAEGKRKEENRRASYTSQTPLEPTLAGSQRRQPEVIERCVGLRAEAAMGLGLAAGLLSANIAAANPD